MLTYMQHTTYYSLHYNLINMLLLIIMYALATDIPTFNALTRSSIYNTCYQIQCSSSKLCSKLVESNNTIILSPCTATKDQKPHCKFINKFSGNCTTEPYTPPIQYLFPGDACDDLDETSSCMYGNRAYLIY